MKTNIIFIAALLYVIITMAFSTRSDEGKQLYEHYCARCHGNDGTRGLFGAKNLRQSGLSDSAIIQQISNGKRIMPSFRKRISADQIYAISIYIKNLRKYK